MGGGVKKLLCSDCLLCCIEECIGVSSLSFLPWWLLSLLIRLSDSFPWLNFCLATGELEACSEKQTAQGFSTRAVCWSSVLPIIHLHSAQDSTSLVTELLHQCTCRSSNTALHSIRKISSRINAVNIDSLMALFYVDLTAIFSQIHFL